MNILEQVISVAAYNFAAEWDLMIRNLIREHGFSQAPPDSDVYSAALALVMCEARLTWDPETGVLREMSADEVELCLQPLFDAEACPGCGCMPGEGRTKGCDHPVGCGFAY